MGKIKQLSKEVINQIAAGEIVQRPSNAIKELIENSIDAKSKSIKIKTKKGGLDLIQIEDDGCGIGSEDLKLAGVRFATSKLTQYEDLKKIESFGFRGEALASISHVSKLEIISKPADQVVAHKIKFLDGQPVGKSTPCAGKNGTIIRAQDLYYNMKTRRETMSSGEEQNKIGEIVRSYAIHYHKISFTLFKVDGAINQIRTAGNIDKCSVIKNVFGKEQGTNMLSFDKTDSSIGVSVSAYHSNLSYEGKKFQFILFINNRLVNCKSIKQMVESVFATFLGKTTKPFVYMSLAMPGKNIDVNVHPTKLEVQFLHEEKILELIQKEFDKNLQPASAERTMKLSETFFSSETSCLLDITLPSQSQNKNRADHKLVREDSQQNTLDSFLVPKEDESFVIGRKKVPISRKRKAESLNLTFSGEQKRQVLSLDSMKELESERISKTDEELKMILANFSVVGAISPSRFAIQHDVNLMLLDMEPLTYDLFYQIILRDYGNFAHVTIKPGIDIEEVLKSTNIVSKEKSTKLLKKLKKSSAMLEDYFSIRISDDGNLESMPIILDGWRPIFNLIYNFLGDLADVDWSSEKQCLEGISKALARFYSIRNDFDEFIAEEEPKWKLIIEHNIISLLKSNVYNPSFSSKRPFKPLTSLPNLYKVFERC